MSNNVRSRAEKDIVHGSVRPGVEIALSIGGLLVTLGASLALGFEIAGDVRTADGLPHAGEQIVFAAIVAGLIYGNVVYQLTRIGYMRRLRRHRAVPEPDHSARFSTRGLPLTILVPSYREEIHVVRQALLSAALQRYPGKRVVLLLDDPPDPAGQKERAALQAMRALPGEIQRRLDECAALVARAAGDMRRRAALHFDADGERIALSRAHTWAAEWFRRQAALHAQRDHADRVFVEATYLGPLAWHKRRARQLLAGEVLTRAEIEIEYVRLESIFRAEMAVFERKRYANLSHLPCKAMNLNAYVGLFGRAFTVVQGEAGSLLVETVAPAPDLVVPDTELLITLDADSILYPDYALRLAEVMTAPGNERLAVVQTPYSAIPGAPGLLERIAGATTDIQYNVHQGFTDHEGTYWVGANALLRMAALRAVCRTTREGAHEVRRYFSDRTVIEDTESSVDLLACGWHLFNFPERLSYSATPADCGALFVQRRRWSNGGLVILPKLLHYLYRRRNPFAKAMEGVVRIHYLLSPTLVNVGLPILLIYPFEHNLRSPWLPLTAVPYFALYGRDLVQIGYRPVDLLRVYALNLMLIPVQLGGIFQSVRQIATGVTVPFERTPKVRSRTVTPRRYVLLIHGFMAYAYLMAIFDLIQGHWFHVGFTVVNGTFFLYAVRRYLTGAPRPAVAGLPVRLAPRTLEPRAAAAGESRRNAGR